MLLQTFNHHIQDQSLPLSDFLTVNEHTEFDIWLSPLGIYNFEATILEKSYEISSVIDFRIAP